MLMMIMVVRMRWNKNVDEGCNTRLWNNKSAKSTEQQFKISTHYDDGDVNFINNHHYGVDGDFTSSLQLARQTELQCFDSPTPPGPVFQEESANTVSPCHCQLHWWWVWSTNLSSQIELVMPHWKVMSGNTRSQIIKKNPNLKEYFLCQGQELTTE